MMMRETELKKLWREYAAECEEIADLCEAEGYPRYGSNYELRCSGIYDWYLQQEEILLDEEV